MKILLDKLFFSFLISFVVCYSMNGQVNNDLRYIDSLTQVIIKEEQGSLTQEKTITELRNNLINSTRSTNLTQEERKRVYDTIRSLNLLNGVFSVVKDKQYNKNTSDTVLKLQQDLVIVNDDLKRIQDNLIRIVDDENNSPEDRKKATYLLISIKNREVLDYLFTNEAKLHFDEPNPDKEEDEIHRTAMRAILSTYKSEDIWLVFPYLFKYLKKMEYSEVYLLHRFAEMYPNHDGPKFLFKFMYVNSTKENRKVIKDFMDAFKYN